MELHIKKRHQAWPDETFVQSHTASITNLESVPRTSSIFFNHDSCWSCTESYNFLSPYSVKLFILSMNFIQLFVQVDSCIALMRESYLHYLIELIFFFQPWYWKFLCFPENFDNLICLCFGLVLRIQLNLWYARLGWPFVAKAVNQSWSLVKIWSGVVMAAAALVLVVDWAASLGEMLMVVFGNSDCGCGGISWLLWQCS